MLLLRVLGAVSHSSHYLITLLSSHNCALIMQSPILSGVSLSPLSRRTALQAGQSGTEAPLAASLIHLQIVLTVHETSLQFTFLNCQLVLGPDTFLVWIRRLSPWASQACCP